MSLTDIISKLYRGAVALVASAAIYVSGCAITLQEDEELVEVYPVECTVTYDVFGPSSDDVERASQFINANYAYNKFFDEKTRDLTEQEIRILTFRNKHHDMSGYPKWWIGGVTGEYISLEEAVGYPPEWYRAKHFLELDAYDGRIDNKISWKSVCSKVEGFSLNGGDEVESAPVSANPIIKFNSEESMEAFVNGVSSAVNPSYVIVKFSEREDYVWSVEDVKRSLREFSSSGIKTERSSDNFSLDELSVEQSVRKKAYVNEAD